MRPSQRTVCLKDQLTKGSHLRTHVKVISCNFILLLVTGLPAHADIFDVEASYTVYLSAEKKCLIRVEPEIVPT